MNGMNDLKMISNMWANRMNRTSLLCGKYNNDIMPFTASMDGYQKAAVGESQSQETVEHGKKRKMMKTVKNNECDTPSRMNMTKTMNLDEDNGRKIMKTMLYDGNHGNNEL